MHSDPVDKPPLNEETLAHYGIKGMHWGKHKKEELSGRKAPTAKPAPKSPAHSGSKDEGDAYALAQQYLAASKKGSKKTPAQAEAELKANQQKFADKFSPEGTDPHKGLTPEQKATLKKIAIGAGIAGAIVGAAYLANKSGSSSSPQTLSQALNKAAPKGSTYAEKVAAHKAHQAAFAETLAGMAGQPIGNHHYAEAVSHSKSVSWSGTYIQESSFKQTGFTLPAGHTFHRISTGVETSYKNGGTYATHSTEDFHRYVAAFRQEKGSQSLHHINFTAVGEFRVPSLVDTLQTMKETLAEMNGKHVDDVPHDKVVSAYQSLSGGSWSKDNPGTAKFFSNLAAKGYHAIVDEMDAGVIGEAPLVIFGHDNLSPMVAKPLTSAAIKAAEAALVEIENRKL